MATHRGNSQYASTDNEPPAGVAKVNPAKSLTSADASALLSAAREAKTQFEGQVKEKGKQLPRHYRAD